ncbi:MAG TPA: MG2 domain-containing protein [Syntrophales bacterium]|nr:MG2 domain-containing protein [Syntrophales bacterium]
MISGHSNPSRRPVGLILLLLLLLPFLSTAPAVHGAAAPGIEQFSPQGSARNVRQVAVRFATAMVPLGDPRLADPFTVSCPEKGSGRWVDSRHWVYDFSRNLPSGVSCRFEPRPGLKDLEGRGLPGAKVYSFTTGGPAVLRSWPGEGSESVHADQAFVLLLDGDADEESIVKHVYFSVAGIGDRVGITILSGEERAAILKTLGLLKQGSRVVVVRARRVFPDETAVNLVWEAGVRSKTGLTREQDQILAFKTSGPFRAEFRCSRENPDRACIPLLPMAVRFSSPVPAAALEKITLKTKAGRVFKPAVRTDDEDAGYVWRALFEGPFPQKGEFTLSLPADLRDEAGRSLANAAQFPLAVRTDAYPPLAKFAGRFGIVESRAGVLLPVTIRNLEADLDAQLLRVVKRPGQPGPEAVSGAPAAKKKAVLDQRLAGKIRPVDGAQESQVIRWLYRVAAAKREAPVLKEEKGVRTLPVSMPAGRQATQVVGLKLPGPGFYIVEMESRILGEHLLQKPAPLYVPAAALVTNLAAHFKWGRESSLVWVTSLDRGEPVKGAAVALRDCTGRPVWEGKTGPDGIALIRKALPRESQLPRCKGETNWEEASRALADIHGGLFVFARSGSDMTFTHSSWNDGIEPWRFNIPTGSGGPEGAVTAHTILDRTLFRAGETVHMKHVIRSRTGQGFTLPGAAAMPKELVIEHRGTGQSYRLPLAWQTGGLAVNAWSIPQGAKLGLYDVSLSMGGKSARRLPSGMFRVEEFRVPLMKAAVQGPREPLVNARQADVDLSVSYLSGGGAGGLAVKLRGEVRDREVSFADWEGYEFTGEPLEEGVTERSRREIPEDGEETGMEPPEVPDRMAPPAKGRLAVQDLVLGTGGAIRARLSDLPAVDCPREIHLEMEFRDPNGEVQTAATNIPLYPSRRLVGIQPESWAASRENLRYRVAVVDLKGRAVPGAEVSVDVYTRKVLSHRVRLVGGFYAYRSSVEITKVGRHCSGRTDKNGRLGCEGPVSQSGSLILAARTADEQGNAALSRRTVWVAGKEDWWFETGNDDRMDVLPERRSYEPGETARFQVRMPFRKATVLVTAEREGVLDAFTRTLSGKGPVLEVPVREHWSPNVFVTVLAVRGRTGTPAPTALFDAGKPAWRFGIGEIQVGWKAHELKVQVLPDREAYRIRERANVKIRVSRADGQPLPKGAEVAVAAVDKGLLQLLGNDSWKLLEAMMSRRPCEVTTSTAQSMVLGKRHFGLKAMPHGGGGGRQITRELFDTLLFWNGRVVLDERGEAAVTIPLNDSLTAFRIAAVALAGSDLFGTGGADIRTTQDLMVLSGLPPLVREGDRFDAAFTLRNTTERSMDVEAVLTAEGLRERPAPQRITLPAGSARDIAWSISVPAGIRTLQYELTAREAGGAVEDRLKVRQQVVEAVPVRAFQGTLEQLRPEARVPVEKPADALAGRGGLEVSLRPKLGQGLAGVRDYMERYPYGCLEQRVSRAVVLGDRNLWQSIVNTLPSYLDADGLLKYFPGMVLGSDVLTSYVLSVTHEAGLSLPEDVKERVSRGLGAFLAGRVKRAGSLPTADLAIRKVAAAEALSRHGGLDVKLLTAIPVDLDLWPTSAVIDWIRLLQHLEGRGGRETSLREALKILRARLSLQGTLLGFSTERNDGLWWLMASADANAAKAMLALLPENEWREDMPRLAKGFLGRMKRGRWDTTVANAWGILAARAFSARYEKDPVAGSTTAGLGTAAKSLAWSSSPQGGVLSLPWPRGTDTLRLAHQGSGAPWAEVRSLAAVPLKKPFASGFRVTRTVRAIEQKKKGAWTAGDVVRVKLEMDAAADMTWVVVSDPVPAGASILRTDIGGGSTLLRAGERSRGYAWPAFTEKSFEACRFYYEYVPKGKWSVEYTLRLNNAGTFHLPPTRVEALYAPEMFGESPNAILKVGAP